MNKYILRVNKDIEYSLLLYDDTFDYSTFNMVVEGESADKLFNDLAEISLLQILAKDSGELIKSTTKYATIEGTSKIAKNTYLDEEGNDIPAIKITLKEADILPRLDKIEQKIYTTIDVDAMSLEEYKSYKKSLVSKACVDAICAGVDYEIDGKTEHFTYYQEDQTNFNDMNNQIEAGLEMIPYHSAKEGKLITSPCKIYPASVVRGIYVAQVMNKFIQTTKCNHVYQWIDGLDNKKDIEPITFDSELPEQYKASYDALIGQITETMKTKDMTKTIVQNVEASVKASFTEYDKKVNEKIENLKTTMVEEVYNKVIERLDDTINTKAEAKINEYLQTKETSIADGVKASILEDVGTEIETKCTEGVKDAINANNIKAEVSSEVKTSVLDTIQPKLNELDKAIEDVKKVIASANKPDKDTTTPETPPSTNGDSDNDSGNL